jgi:ribonuclease J
VIGSTVRSLRKTAAVYIRRLADALEPERVVPIHSFAADQYAKIFASVDRKRDGEWWGV